jgi:hypothetical protein
MVGKWCSRPGQQRPRDGKMGSKIKILNGKMSFWAQKIFKC